jgi:hypothetical protein
VKFKRKRISILLIFLTWHNFGVCLPPPKRVLGLLWRYVGVDFYRGSDWMPDSFPEGSLRSRWADPGSVSFLSSMLQGWNPLRANGSFFFRY